MIVLHAVTPAVREEAGLAGLRAHTSGPVSVLYDEQSSEPEPSREAILEYGARINMLALERPILPMRYGTTTSGLGELEALVREHAATWRRRLAKVEGRCEVLVHLEVATEDADARPATGAAYLRQRAAAIHHRDARQAEAEELLATWASELRLLSDGRRLAALVRPAHVPELTEALHEWAAGCGDVEVAITGPWPPFSFCDEVGPS